MANKIQILRNGTISTTRDAAVTALKTKLATLSDGEIAINRYEVSGSDQVKVILGFNNTVGSNGATKQFIFDADAIPADVQTELEKITGDTGTIAKLKEEIIGKNTDTKDANTVYGAKAYAKDYADTKVASLDVTDTVTKGSVVVAVSETDGKVSSTKATITSSDKTVNVSSADNGNITLAANIDGKTIVKNATSGVLSVASSALTQYVGSNAIAVSAADTDNNKTISLGINTNDKVLSQSTSGLLASLSLNYSSTDKTITLVGKDNTVISKIPTNDFVKDGMLNDAKAFLASGTSQVVTFKGGKHTFDGLTKGNHYIGFEFKTSDGTTTGTSYTYDSLDATTIIDVYVAGNGLALTNHTFSVKKDTTSQDSEDFLSVSENGVKVSGVQAAINKAKSVVVNKDQDAHVKVASSTDTTDGHTIYTVESVDTASATDLTNEITARKAVDGQSGQTYAANTSTKYIKSATSLNDADIKLDAAIGVLNDADTVTGSVAKSIKDAINALDVTDSATVGSFVTSVSETDGQVSVTKAALSGYLKSDDKSVTLSTANGVTDFKVNVDGETIVKDTTSGALKFGTVTIDCGTY